MQIAYNPRYHHQHDQYYKKQDTPGHGKHHHHRLNHYDQHNRLSNHMYHYNVCHQHYHQHDQHLKEVQTFVASGDRLPDRGQRGEDPLAVRHVPCPAETSTGSEILSLLRISEFFQFI